MDLYERELEAAKSAIRAGGRDADDYSFEMTHLPPDPDGGAMFTMRYEIEISNRRTSKSAVAVGGIGLNWVQDFEAALEEGYFD